MHNEITPEDVENAAARALTPLTQFLRSAGVGSSTFYRWKYGTEVRKLTIEKLRRAVARVNGEL